MTTPASRKRVVRCNTHHSQCAKPSCSHHTDRHTADRCASTSVTLRVSAATRVMLSVPSPAARTTSTVTPPPCVPTPVSRYASSAVTTRSAQRAEPSRLHHTDRHTADRCSHTSVTPSRFRCITRLCSVRRAQLLAPHRPSHRRPVRPHQRLATVLSDVTTRLCSCVETTPTVTPPTGVPPPDHATALPAVQSVSAQCTEPSRSLHTDRHPADRCADTSVPPPRRPM